MRCAFGFRVRAGRAEAGNAIVYLRLVLIRLTSRADQRGPNDNARGLGEILILRIYRPRSRTGRPSQRNSGA